MSTTDGKAFVVVGLGNPLMGDDGLGLCALEQLAREWAIDASTQLVDGGTWGLSLLPSLEGATGLLFLDAIRTNNAPGTVVELRGEEIPRKIVTKLSPHEIDLREVLAVMQLRGTLPRDVSAIGVEPEDVDLRDGLSATVQSRLSDVVRLAIARLESWGVRCTPATVSSTGSALPCTR
ncbi:MAG TPA: HyaD/HybD family hydrogenase maturation endopeptidase [Gemmatimonadaceae bacterium]|jgi:hydrogenase maturation protease